MEQGLLDLLECCIVKLTIPDKGKGRHGTGFFVAPGLILTCAHLIKVTKLSDDKHVDIINVRWKDQEHFTQATVKQWLPDSDIVLLKFDSPSIPELPCVYLDEDVKCGDKLYTFGYPDKDFPNGRSVTFDCEGWTGTGDEPPQIIYKLGQVRPGMSGAPLLNERTGKVCGMVNLTLGRDNLKGGLAISTSVILSQVKDLPNLQKCFHLKNPRWTNEINSPLPFSEEIHEFVVKNYLNEPYNQKSLVHKHSYEEYSKFFSIVSQSNQRNTGAYLFKSFKDLSEIILNSTSKVALWLQGPPGTGKTSFLSILYWYFYDLYFSVEKDLLPIFIDLHRYSGLESEGKNYSISQEQMLNEVKQHLQVLEKLMKAIPEQKILVIIDGYDRYSKVEENIFKYLLEEHFVLYPHVCVIGSKIKYDLLIDIHILRYLPQKTLLFNSLEIDEHPVYEFIEAFLKISLPNGYAEKAEYLLDILKRYKLEQIDLFSLSLLKYGTKVEGGQLPPLLKLLKGYCQNYLTKNRSRLKSQGIDIGDMLNRAARIAFSDEFIKETDLKDKKEVAFFRGLVDCHPKICDFLIAHYVINKLFEITEKINDKPTDEVVKVLQCVQPHRINQLCKEIANQNDDNKYKVFSAIEKLLQMDKIHCYAKSFACYLLGRLEGDQWKHYAHGILEKFKQTLKPDTAEDEHNYLFLSRTAYVSLAYLGDKDAQKDYVTMLLSDPKVDQLNRGFHLEYYGDEKYSASIKLISKDYLNPFPRTFKKLSNNVISKKSNPLFEIEVHTLCSLAQHRHAIGKLAKDNRQSLIKIIKEVINNNKINHDRLRTYIRMIYKHIKQEHFCIGSIFNSYYQIKFEKRKGWLDREIKNGESVADHMYGAYLIALYLLPDTWKEEPNYSKREIIEMLLIHDLAEAIVHDIPPDKKTDRHKQEESQIYDEIEVLGTYDGLADLKNVAALWRNFEAGQTFNAKVAKEIDILENWVQLQIYKAKGYKINDYIEWSQGLLNQIRTNIGHQITERLQQVYGNSL